MAITKVQIDSVYGKGELTESRVSLTLPGASAEAKPLCRFVHLTDLHISCHRPGDSAEAVELADARAEFWQNQGGFFTQLPDGGERKLFPCETIELVADRVRELSPDLVFFTGDTVDFPSVSNFRHAGDYMRSLGAECIMAPGNHDHIGDGADSALTEAYEYAVGTLEDFSVRTFGGIDIISAGDGFGRVTAEQTEKLRAQLEKGRPTIVLLHAPVVTESMKLPSMRMWGLDLGKWAIGAEGQPEECMEFLRLLNSHRDTVMAVFAGHVHVLSGGGEGADNGEGFSEEEVLQYTAKPAFTGFLRVIDVFG